MRVSEPDQNKVFVSGAWPLAEAEAEAAAGRRRRRVAASGAGAEAKAAAADATPSLFPRRRATDHHRRTITQLETAVEEQRQLRLQDARQVEAKAARIKQWVALKLRDLEAQNAVLREQNARCAAQLDLLRAHLATHAQQQHHHHLAPPAGAGRSSSAGGSSSRASLSLEAESGAELAELEEESAGAGGAGGAGGALRGRPRSAASDAASSLASAASLPHEPLYACADPLGLGRSHADRLELCGTEVDDEAEELSRDLRAAVAQLQLCTGSGAAGPGAAPSPAPQRRHLRHARRLLLDAHDPDPPDSDVPVAARSAPRPPRRACARPPPLSGRPPPAQPPRRPARPRPSLRPVLRSQSP
ncbi:Uncharacterized protein CG42248, partial [Gryllus bimaculatus]